MTYSANPLDAYGFLTFVDSPDAGIFGGYLALSSRGRPLEFRCSTPLAPNRAQAILYGVALRPYLVAEVIGPALLKKREIAAPLILTDDRHALQITGFETGNLAHISRETSTSEPSVARSLHGETSSGSRGVAQSFRGYVYECPHLAAISGEDASRQIEPLANAVDLLEPFERIRAALAEMRQAANCEPHELDEARDVAA